MAAGRCSVEREGAATPDVVYEVAGVDFLRLVSGQVDGPQLFVSGRIRVEGDLMLAARMPALFRPAGGPNLS
jgi:putative sterol carrier protein